MRIIVLQKNVCQEMSIEDKIKDNHCRCSCDPDNEVRGTDIDVGLPRSAEIYGMKLGLEA